MLWEQAGITSVAELEQAARDGKLAGLPGIGPKMEAKIIANIAATRKRGASERTPLASPILCRCDVEALDVCDSVLRASVAGSLRRMKETIGDIDLLVAAEEADPVMTPSYLWSKSLKSSRAARPSRACGWHTGQQVDLRVIQPQQWGARCNTSPAQRSQRAPARDCLKKGYSLNETR